MYAVCIVPGESPVHDERFAPVTLFRGSIDPWQEGVRAHSYFEFRDIGRCIVAVSIHPHYYYLHFVVGIYHGEPILHDAKFHASSELWILFKKNLLKGCMLISSIFFFSIKLQNLSEPRRYLKRIWFLLISWNPTRTIIGTDIIPFYRYRMIVFENINVKGSNH